MAFHSARAVDGKSHCLNDFSAEQIKVVVQYFFLWTPYQGGLRLSEYPEKSSLVGLIVGFMTNRMKGD